MSRGPGRIERAIRELFDANPELAFVTDELAEHCYPGVTIERKHQVAVLRAAHSVVEADPNWEAWRIEGQGRRWAFVNRDNVRSYAQGRLICDSWRYYRSEKRARRFVGYHDDLVGCCSPGPGMKVEGRMITSGLNAGFTFNRIWYRCDHLIGDRVSLLEKLEEPRYRELIAEGGAWHLHTMQHRAKRDGDETTRAALEARNEAELQSYAARIRKCFSAGRAGDKETLTELAAKARALGTQNDPDAVRAGLAEIADALDALAGASSYREAAD